MPITVTWDNAARTIIRTERTSPWTWADFDIAIDESYALMRSVSHIVDVIDILDSAEVPKGLALPHILRMLRLRPRNAGITIVVGKQGHKSFGAKVLEAVFTVNQRADERTKYASSL